MTPRPGISQFRVANTALYLAFILTGIVNTMLGPLLPFLSRRWDLTDAQAGAFFTAQFLSSILGVLTTSVLTPRRGPAVTLACGFTFMAAGCALLVAGSFSQGLIAAVIFGFGLGLDTPTVNFLVSELNPSRRASALNLINMAWGVGAVLCPALLIWQRRAWHAETGGEAVFLRVVACALFVFAVGLWLVFRRWPGAASGTREILERRHWRWTDSSVLLMAATFFLYVGCETSVGGWAASHARRIGGDNGIWLAVPSLFWLMLMAGRGLAPLFLQSLPELVLARCGLVLAICGTLGLLWVQDSRALSVAAGISGLGFASVFPIAISVLTRRFGIFAAQLIGPMFALASFGGAMLPWLVGYVSTKSASLRTGLLIPLAGCLVLFAINLLTARTAFWNQPRES